MVDSIFHDFYKNTKYKIQKSEDSVVHSEKQEDAKPDDARGTFGLINDKKAAGRKTWK